VGVCADSSTSSEIAPPNSAVDVDNGFDAVTRRPPISCRIRYCGATIDGRYRSWYSTRNSTFAGEGLWRAYT
jgi:hypothetical protein